MTMGYGEFLVSAGFTKLMLQNLKKDARGLTMEPDFRDMNYVAKRV